LSHHNDEISGGGGLTEDFKRTQAPAVRFIDGYASRYTVAELLLCICAATLYTGAISYSLRNWFIARIFSLGVPGTIPSLLAI